MGTDLSDRGAGGWGHESGGSTSRA